MSVFRRAGWFLLEGDVCGGSDGAGACRELLARLCCLYPGAFSVSSLAPRIVSLWISAMPMQLHCFQLSCDGVAEMGTWRRALAGEGCSSASWLSPAAHQRQHPCCAGHRRAGEKWPTCKASSRPLEICRTWCSFVLESQCSESFCGVTGRCGHGEDFLWKAMMMSHQWNPLQVGGCLFQELQMRNLLIKVGGRGMGPTKLDYL